MKRAKFMGRMALICMLTALVSMGCPGPSNNPPPPPPPVTDLKVTPASGLIASGIKGGPFNPSSVIYTLENTAETSLSWTVGKTQAWVTLSSTGGTLDTGLSTQVTVSINSTANSLAVGSHSDTVTFTNTTNGSGSTTRSVSIAIMSDPNPCTGLKIFNGGRLDDLRALCPTLEFGDLIMNGDLSLYPNDLPAVNIKAANFTFGGRFLFGQDKCSYKPAPNINITATGSVVIDGDVSGFYVEGKGGDRESYMTPNSCNDCNGVKGGNVTIQAVDIRIGETKGGLFDVTGGPGSLFMGNGYTVSCDCGAGGTITLNASGRLLIGPKTIMKLYSIDDRPAADGTLIMSGSPVEVYEKSLRSNAVISSDYWQNHYIDRLLNYQRFTLYGSVNQADDIGDKGKVGSVYLTYTNPTATDFCEDLYVLNLKNAAAISLNLSSAGAGDLDMHLLSFDLTQVLRSSTGPTSSESITYSAAAGKYVICVSWWDDQVPASQPQPYTLEVGL